jgi:pimeloyl-ACP methyl ester carboxylesterase
MAGAIAPLVATRDPGRAASLTLVSTTPGDPGLSPMADAVVRYTAGPGPDPTDPAAVVAFIVGLMRAYAGGSPHFDEAATRALAERDVARTASIASCLANHFLVAFDDAVAPADAAVPTLVVHGDRDPVFGLDHGRALQRAIPGADLLVLEDTGHDVPPPVWDRFVAALLAHTAAS